MQRNIIERVYMSNTNVVSYDEIRKVLSKDSKSILSMLFDIGELTLTEIQERKKISRERSYKAISMLTGACLIYTRRSEEDMRLYKYNLTEHGMRIVQTI